MIIDRMLKNNYNIVDIVKVLWTLLLISMLRKSLNIGFLNVQGICGGEMGKFSEINLMLTSK